MKNYHTLKRCYHDKNLRKQYDEIYKERFNSLSTYKLPLKIKVNDCEFQLFVYLTKEVYEASVKILEMKDQLKEIKKLLPEAALSQFISQSLVQELMQTNSIEGVQSTPEEIKEAMSASYSAKRKRFVGLVNKYRLLLGKETLTLDSPKDIRVIYDELLEGEIEKDYLPDGQVFRKKGVDVTTGSGKVIHSGVFPESNIIELMENNLNFSNDDTFPELLRIAIFHYYFGYIHPFYDGNGRTSRFISSYYLSRYIDPLIGFRLSYTIRDNLKEYEKAFIESNHALNKGEVTAFYIMFLNILQISLEELIESLYEKLNLLNFSREKLSILEADKTITEDECKILFLLQQAQLFSDEKFVVSQIAQYSGIKEYKVRTLTKQLKDKDLISITKQGNAYNYELKIDLLQ